MMIIIMIIIVVMIIVVIMRTAMIMTIKIILKFIIDYGDNDENIRWDNKNSNEYI